MLIGCNTKFGIISSSKIAVVVLYFFEQPDEVLLEDRLRKQVVNAELD